MKISRFFAVASFAIITCYAKADPIAQLTFDMSFNGFTTMDGQFKGYFTDPSKPIHDTIVVTLPFTVSSVQKYDNSYANNYLLNFGKGWPSAGVTIASGKMDTIFSGEEYNTLVNNELKQIGVTATSPSAKFPSPLNYAFLGKRDVHGVPDAQRFYTYIDASTQITKDVTGIENAKFFTMVRLNGGIFGQSGNIDPFALSDVPAMLLNIDKQNSPGFVINYTNFVDIISPTNGSWMGRPLEVIYQGTGKLTGFTIDGVNQMPSAVPEPETYALLFAGLGMIGLLARRQRKV